MWKERGKGDGDADTPALRKGTGIGGGNSRTFGETKLRRQAWAAVARTFGLVTVNMWVFKSHTHGKEEKGFVEFDVQEWSEETGKKGVNLHNKN